MTDTVEEIHPFLPGTIGWTVHDLDDPQIARLWDEGRYEIIEGVLAKMPPAYFKGGRAMSNIVFIMRTFLRLRKIPGTFGTEVDIALSDTRLVVADGAFLTPDDLNLQTKMVGASSVDAATEHRLVVPPLLVIESSSLGHEAHDTKIKKKWYADFGVPNYWILNPYTRTLSCFCLENGKYMLDIGGSNDDIVKPNLFPGLSIELHRVWND